MIPSVDKKLVDKLLKDFRLREEMGLKKYNKYVSTLCSENMIKESYEEILDFLVYIRCAIEKEKNVERNGNSVWNTIIREAEELSEDNNFCQALANKVFPKGELSESLFYCYYLNLLVALSLKNSLLNQKGENNV